ncbi:MAG: hypothetical protein GY801_09740, partial [bacterium]|nr:hypothetical protein [bacterium]
MKILSVIFVSLVLAIVGTGNATQAENLHRLGAGIHYWASIEDIIIEDAHNDGLAVMLSYQYQFVKF